MWKTDFGKPVRFGSGSVFDYYVQFKDNKVGFVEWKKLLEERTVNFESGMNMQSITVPIPETVSIQEITRCLIY
jgi:dynein heavy chain, axonemal